MYMERWSETNRIRHLRGVGRDIWEEWVWHVGGMGVSLGQWRDARVAAGRPIRLLHRLGGFVLAGGCASFGGGGGVRVGREKRT